MCIAEVSIPTAYSARGIDRYRETVRELKSRRSARLFKSLADTLSHVISRAANACYVSDGSHTARELFRALPYDCIFIAHRRTAGRDALTP